MIELRWNEVAKVHGTVAGISVRGGVVVSLLCNQQKAGPYPDRIEGDTLTYYVGRRTQAHGVERLFELVAAPRPITVFEKLGVNRWLNLGVWSPVGVGEQSGGMIPIEFQRVR